MDHLESLFGDITPAVDFCSLRAVTTRETHLSVKRDVCDPLHQSIDSGVMITVVHGGGLGYGATCDLSREGLKRAAAKAVEFAAQTAGRSVVDFEQITFPAPIGEYCSAEERPWEDVSLTDKYDYLRKACARLKNDDRIVDWGTSVTRTIRDTLYLTNHGGRLRQEFRFTAPSMSVTANCGADTQTRSLGGLQANCHQGGMEVFKACNFKRAPHRLTEEVIALLGAENCPTGTMDLLLAPDQMMLQIHESIGHPLEIDRILGDERNYAGTSFVTPEMFGTFQYGSELLNVTFDPTIPHEMATYAFDDDGLEAKKEFLIRDGLLVRGLGGLTSQHRSGLEGVANSRASNWNRPPVDRMANLNLEPGDQTIPEMIEQTERGVLMRTNVSWSIDDSRNKFQFGCEFGEKIVNGKIVGIVKNPNYRGISKTFWQNLAGVGKAETVGVFGTPYCGKAEPNQCVFVGHASPTCRFTNVEVFGGE
ncbi:MAG: TldD/PmbA family protein [Phycisphaerales bacterium]|nr:TldD/PmbA family protein [Phycisphaerales bacterium]